MRDLRLVKLILYSAVWRWDSFLPRQSCLFFGILAHTTLMLLIAPVAGAAVCIMTETDGVTNAASALATDLLTLAMMLNGSRPELLDVEGLFFGLKWRPIFHLLTV